MSEVLPSPRPTKPSKPRRLRLPSPKRVDWRTLDIKAIDHGDDDTLIPELFTFQRHLVELLKTNKGQYVLIKGDEIVGIYPTQFEALDEAVERFGEVPALVKKIVAREPVHYLGGGIL